MFRQGAKVQSIRGGGVGGAPPPRTGFARATYPTSSHSATHLSSFVPHLESSVTLRTTNSLRFAGGFAVGRVRARRGAERTAGCSRAVCTRRCGSGSDVRASCSPRRRPTDPCADLAAARPPCSPSLAGCVRRERRPGDADPATRRPGRRASTSRRRCGPRATCATDALAAAGKVLRADDPEARIRELVDAGGREADEPSSTTTRDVEPWLGERAGVLARGRRTRTATRGVAVLVAATDTREGAGVDRRRRASGGGEKITERSLRGRRLRGRRATAWRRPSSRTSSSSATEAELKRTIDALGGRRRSPSDDRYTDAIDELEDERLGALLRRHAALRRAGAQEATRARGSSAEQFEALIPLDKLRPDRGLVLGRRRRGWRSTRVDRARREAARQLGALSGHRRRPRCSTSCPGDAGARSGTPELGETLRVALRSSRGALGGAAIAGQLAQQLGLDLEQDVFSWIGDAAFFVRGDARGRARRRRR